MIEALIAAVMMVESSNNTKAIGDHGKAVGALQIHMVVVKDVNRGFGTKFTSKDRFDLAKSKQIFRLYVRLHGAKTSQEAALLWHTGPSKRYDATYLRKVNKCLRYGGTPAR